MKFDNYITELFTTDVDLDIKSYKDEWKAQFRVDGIGYEFFASYTEDQVDSDKKAWEVSFYHWNSRRSEFPPAPSLRVFNAVVQAFTKFLKAKNPVGVWFSPSSKKLSKLYERFERYMNKAGFKRIRSSPGLHVYRKGVNEASVTFQDEVVGTQSGQKDLRLTAYIGKDQVGWLDYTDFHGDISIKMVKVKPQYRRQGIGKELILKLQKQYPKTEISTGLATGEGGKLLKSLKSSLYVDKAKIKKTKQLEKEFKDLGKEEQHLVKQLKPGSPDNDTIGNRLNVISDRQYEIEQELHDIRGK